MPVPRDTCAFDGTGSPCASVRLRFPASDALLFCAAPEDDGSLAPHLVLAVAADGTVHTWRPGLPEDAMAEVLGGVREFLAELGTGAPLPEGALRCGNPEHDVTVILRRLPDGLVLGTAVASGGRTERPGTTGGVLEGLPAPSRRLVQALAVLGGPVAVPRLGTLVDEPDALAGALQSALDAGFLRWHARSGEAEVPEDLRGRLLGGMTPPERQAAHAWAERWSDGPDALLHRAAAAQAPSPSLADALEKEAEALSAEGYSAQAATLLRYAADLSSDPATGTQRLLHSIEHDLRLHRCSTAGAALRALRGHRPSVHERVLAGRLSVLEGDLRTGLALLTEAHERLAAEAQSAPGPASVPSGPSGTDGRHGSPYDGATQQTSARSGSSPAAAQNGAIRPAAPRNGVTRQIAPHHLGVRQSPHADVRQASLLWLAEARWLAGRPTSVIRPLLEASRRTATHDPYWHGMRAWLDMLLAAADQGPAEALSAIRSASLPAHPRSASASRKTLLIEAWLHLEAGDLDRCESAVHRALDVSAISEASSADGLPLVLLGHLHWMRGNWAQADLHASMAVNSATPLWRPLGESLGLLIASSRGEAAEDDERCRSVGAEEQPVLCAWSGLFARLVGAVEADDAARVAAVLGADRPRSGTSGLPTALMPWRELELLRAAVLVGDTTLLERSLRSMRRLRRRSASAWIRMFGAWGEALAAAHAGRRENALEHYAEAERQAAAAGARTPWYRARLQADHADVLANVGKRRAALDRYRAAQETAAELGARPLHHRCAAGLTRLRLPRSANGYGLTDREADVVALVASGLTNKETAARLFVTPASIAFHLSNIYAKTGVSNRYELRAWWQSLGEAAD
ncbi:helix-turn-helix transcriptional regulator [Streptomyces sp. NPDC047108]|uniref:helix-turn-helix transcriptional regulator n=1 Tax=Streptomyces sp. NPDC047108 TaxID=3155025 RepID=UPI0033CDD722